MVDQLRVGRPGGHVRLGEAGADGPRHRRLISWPVGYRTGFPTDAHEQPPRLQMTEPNLRSNANCLWSIADDIFPRTLLRRAQRGAGAHQASDPRLEGRAGRQRGHEPTGGPPDGAELGPRQHLPLTLRDLRASARSQQLLADFADYLGEFSSNMPDILDAEIGTPRPTLGPKPISKWATGRFSIGIPPTYDRCVP